jgi:hypothetical protein
MCYALDFVTLRRKIMFPVRQHTRIRQHKGYVHRCILDANTFVGTTPEYQVVPRVCVGRTLRVEPSFRNERVRFGENGGIMQRIIE